ncbi:MAG: hypothetical protein ACHP9Z_06070 [Streptosporangiales bacterium]
MTWPVQAAAGCGRYGAEPAGAFIWPSRSRAGDADVQVGQEAVDGLPLGLDGDPELLLQP